MSTSRIPVHDDVIVVVVLCSTRQVGMGWFVLIRSFLLGSRGRRFRVCPGPRVDDDNGDRREEARGACSIFQESYSVDSFTASMNCLLSPAHSNNIIVMYSVKGCSLNLLLWMLLFNCWCRQDVVDVRPINEGYWSYGCSLFVTQIKLVTRKNNLLLSAYSTRSRSYILYHRRLSTPFQNDKSNRHRERRERW